MRRPKRRLTHGRTCKQRKRADARAGVRNAALGATDTANENTKTRIGDLLRIRWQRARYRSVFDSRNGRVRRVPTDRMEAQELRQSQER
eukprot:1113630-Pleurochrysis_carterae.AAC.1